MKGTGMLGEKFRYCVLYTRVTDQEKLKNVMERNLAEGHGKVFVPRMELYRRGDKQLKEIPLFPGYVFLYTDLDLREVHEMLKGCRKELDSPTRELKLRERGMDDPDFFYRKPEDEELYELSDLDGEETGFLDILRQGDGLLAMSCGYEEDRKYHVMEGPLQAYENKIQKVDKHNRKAFLLFEIRGKQAKAGFECKPKAHWYPKEDARVASLSDGTEVDLTELKRNLMKIS